MSQSTNTAIYIPYGDIYRTNEGVFKKGEKTDTRISNYIAIKNIYSNIDSDEVVAEVEYDGVRGRQTILIPKVDYVNPQRLLNYAGKGIDLMKNTADAISRHLRNEEARAPVVLTHTKLGFSMFEGKEIYKLNHSIGVESSYRGDYQINPMGKRDKYVDMLKQEVFGHVPLEFILVVSLSAITVGFIGEELSLDTIIVHLKGNSTMGKSTAVKLGISAFGYPDTKKTGLFSTYNSTPNALIKQLVGIKGVPFAFDELSMLSSKDTTKLIYTLANGADKGRLDSDSKMQEKGTWHTVVISTGEKSLVQSANKNIGVQNRVIEIEDTMYTRSAENALNISKCIQRNYGHIAYDFAEHLLKLGKEQAMDKYDRAFDIVYKNLKKKGVVDRYTERRVKSYAIILLSAIQCSEVLGYKMNVKGILKFIVSIEKQALVQRNYDKVVIDFIKMFVNDNFSKFYKAGTSSPNMGSYWGRIRETSQGVEVEILPNKFEEMLTKGNFEDKNVVLKELKENGYLNCDKDRYTRDRKTLLNVAQAVYVVKIK